MEGCEAHNASSEASLPGVKERLPGFFTVDNTGGMLNNLQHSWSHSGDWGHNVS